MNEWCVELEIVTRVLEDLNRMLDTSLVQSGLHRSALKVYASINPSGRLTRPRRNGQHRYSLNHCNLSSVKPRRSAPCASTSDSPNLMGTDVDRTTGQVEGNGAKCQILDYKVAVFSAQPYVKDFLDGPFSQNFAKYSFFDAQLDKSTANLAQGCDAVCLFVNDSADKEVLEILANQGIKMIAMRCAGYDRVDLQAAKDLGIIVTRVPAYSPRSVAEHALSLMFCIARNTHLAYDRVISGNYTLNGLVGIELSGKTFGIIGTGNIGIEMIKLLAGFHGNILAYDVNESAAAVEAGAEYVDLDQLLKESDIISLHVPLLASTHHIINKERIGMMKKHAILINVSRGGLIDTDALVNALEHDHLFGVGLDVYDKEDSLFFKDFTEMKKENRMKAWDRSFKLLVSLPQVIVTPHVAFLTQEALKNIGDTVVVNLRAAALGEVLVNEVKMK